MKVSRVSASTNYSKYSSYSTASNEAIIILRGKQKASMQHKKEQFAASEDNDNIGANSSLEQQIEDLEANISKTISSLKLQVQRLETNISRAKPITYATESNSYISKSSSEIANNIGPAYSLELSRKQSSYRSLGYTTGSQVTYIAANNI
ncbi:MAG: hypothetical protein K0Q53_3 [Massilibacillus sp.]|jgi:hypothetical protein|nr:hypothetical protein [Massilibacillus sp.]